MVFVDEARIIVKAGDGGRGCESYFSDKLRRHPYPDGGDGGKGGDIVFVADKSIQTLLDFRYRQHHKAQNGVPGKGKGRTGRRGEDTVLRVPLGTIIWDDETGLIIKDLTYHDQKIVVAAGGQGGKGNAHHKTPTPPTAGEQKRIRLELKLIADVGLIGFPNAGKSTIVSAVSRVRSKVANYPFTTKSPVLGFVKGEKTDFVIADLPGLIEGAHNGRGLGDRFLKHAERTKILVHVIDMGASEGRDPVDDFNKINHELYEYGGHLAGKKKILVANKMDLPAAEKNLKKFKKAIDREIFAVSALQKQGLEQLIDHIRGILCQEDSQDQ